MSPPTESRSPPLFRAAHHELANSLTHGTGWLLSLFATFLLAKQVLPSGNLLLIVGCGIYTFSLLAVYAASTLSHAVTNPRWKHRWWLWDQGLIYLLIAGSYTGFGLPLLQITANRWLLAAIWALALAGFFFKILRRHQNDKTSTISYVALAWGPILGVQAATTLLPTSSLYWLFFGGLFYTSGVLFLLLDRRMPYFHALWHLLVIAGSFCHFIGIYQIVLSMLGAGTETAGLES